MGRTIPLHKAISRGSVDTDAWTMLYVHLLGDGRMPKGEKVHRPREWSVRSPGRRILHKMDPGGRSGIDHEEVLFCSLEKAVRGGRAFRGTSEGEAVRWLATIVFREWISKKRAMPRRGPIPFDSTGATPENKSIRDAATPYRDRDGPLDDAERDVTVKEHCTLVMESLHRMRSATSKVRRREALVYQLIVLEEIADKEIPDHPEYRAMLDRPLDSEKERSRAYSLVRKDLERARRRIAEELGLERIRRRGSP